jgi:hypothetical protein
LAGSFHASSFLFHPPAPTIHSLDLIHTPQKQTNARTINNKESKVREREKKKEQKQAQSARTDQTSTREEIHTHTHTRIRREEEDRKTTSGKRECVLF